MFADRQAWKFRRIRASPERGLGMTILTNKAGRAPRGCGHLESHAGVGELVGRGLCQRGGSMCILGREKW